MNIIAIDKKRDIIVIEKSDGKNILKGSKLFCGCCGKSIGEAKRKLTFPFSSKYFVSNLTNTSFRYGIMGSLYHNTCHHTLFSCSGGWGFITFENYQKQIAIAA